MKSTFIILASLAMGTAAIAQDTTAQPPATPDASMQPSTPAPPATTDQPPATAPTTPGTPDSSMPPAATPTTPNSTGSTMPPASTDQTMPPAASGSSMTPNSMGQTGAATGSAGMPQTSAADTANYPKCSRTVTDKCVQAGGTRKTAMRKHRR